MRWPWQHRTMNGRLVVSWSGTTLAYVLARGQANGRLALKKWGQIHTPHTGKAALDDLADQLRALNLKGVRSQFMLRPQQYQILQIDTPTVAPEELRSAARYRIKEMLDAHVDDVTLDVMRVGSGSDSSQKGAGSLFVVAATHSVIRQLLDLSEAMHWDVTVVDIQDTAQRNLQNALVAKDGDSAHAHAALVLVDGHQAVLTICANDELYYTRRIDVPPGFLQSSWQLPGEVPHEPSGFNPVDEYVPDYAVGGVSYGNDYGSASLASATPAVQDDDDLAQRFAMEVQRSLDVWGRSWSELPLSGLRVWAGERSQELAKWLQLQVGQIVMPLDAQPLFTGLSESDKVRGTPEHMASCLPLLGVLLRTESRKL